MPHRTNDPPPSPLSPPAAGGPASVDPARPWQERLAFMVDMMRELSRQTDPQEMVRTYAARMRQVMPTDGFISLSRRGLERPHYRITRSTLWERRNESVNPWKDKARLPVFDRGLLGDLIYGEEPAVLDDLPSRVAPDDPAREFLEGMGSLVAIPLFDGGRSINMVISLRRTPDGYRREELPERVWMSNLFGRATQNLVLSEEVRKAYDVVDRELKAVADIQRSLLPSVLPDVPGLDLAAHYQTSQRAGGDYYDFFPLPNGQWGILIADVSGHGTPAAVLMAVTHSIAHTAADPGTPPSRLLKFVNDRLTAAYTGQGGHFVTAFYGVYDPATRTLAFSNAGHPPPRLRRAGDVATAGVTGASSLPLGIDADEPYRDATLTLHPGDALAFYTDGITEARDPTDKDEFGDARLDAALDACTGDARACVGAVLASLEAFTGGRPASDDRTMLVARVR